MISDINAVRSGDGLEAVITWTTNEPADSRVIYCEDRNMRINAKAEYDDTMTQEHIIIVTGLEPQKRYYFEVGSDNGRNYALSNVYEIRGGESR